MTDSNVSIDTLAEEIVPSLPRSLLGKVASVAIATVGMHLFLPALPAALRAMYFDAPIDHILYLSAVAGASGFAAGAGAWLIAGYMYREDQNGLDREQVGEFLEEARQTKQHFLPRYSILGEDA